MFANYNCLTSKDQIPSKNQLFLIGQTIRDNSDLVVESGEKDKQLQQNIQVYLKMQECILRNRIGSQGEFFAPSIKGEKLGQSEPRPKHIDQKSEISL